MAPSASILIPTRRRPEYLAVALASLGAGRDVVAEDADASFVWGANMAVRRSAFERVGPFDESLGGAGDEEDWQRRLRAAGGRIAYVAAAGVDHRRAGADARLPTLCRAALRRGRHSRRYDVRKGTQPSLAGELR